MAIKPSVNSQPDTYFALVKQFPLVHIRDNAHLENALELIDSLQRTALDDGQEAYLDVLTDLVEAHEENRIQIRDASEADVLQELMNANGLNQLTLAKLVRISQSTISAVLTGNRSLTKSQVELFARRFKVSPAVFFPA